MFTQKTFYKSRKWEKFREVIINERTNKDGLVICELCGEPIVKKYDLILDHIQELDDDNVNDFAISLNPSNVRCVHFKCHNERHKRFGFGNVTPVEKKVYIVYGAPCAGKTTWVKDNANENDLVIDLDSIFQMISINEKYIKPDSLKSVAFEVLDKLYDIVKYRVGRWHNAFIITGVPLLGDRERLMQRLNADDCIYVDAKRSECLMRAEAVRGKEWVEYVNNWFDSYQPTTPPAE